MPDHIWNRPSAWVLGARGAFAMHQAAYRATGGLFGHRFGKLTCLLLTTRGAKSGLAHPAPALWT